MATTITAAGLTTIITSFLAVVVFVLTQSFLKLVLEPIQDQRVL